MKTFQLLETPLVKVRDVAVAALPLSFSRPRRLTLGLLVRCYERRDLQRKQLVSDDEPGNGERR